jgi:dolichol-phosphate mannosyltransferase
LSVVVPAYNEVESLPLLLARLRGVLAPLGPYEVVIIDDGSRDGTIEFLRRAGAEHPELRYVSFSRNFGHQNALRAGLVEARGDCVITMDADLQHPPELIPELLAGWRAGADVVYTVRRDDNTSWFKRRTAALYYRMLAALSDDPPAPGSADFRLLDRRVVDVFAELKEHTIFLRGLVPWVGFRQAEVPYTPDARKTGVTKYTVHRMMRLAMEGVTATSIRPLMLASMFGVFLALTAIVYAGYAIYIRVHTGTAVPGWTSTVVVTALIGGTQLIFMGVLGAYVGQVLREVRGRPPYIVRERSDERR